MNDKTIEKAVSEYGTPLYLYDMNNIGSHLKELQDAIMDKATVYYSMKANPLLGICQYMKEKGSGVEVASKGEMFIALQAGFQPENIIFTSPGKTVEEIRYAIDNKIKLINIESLEEAQLINQEAKAQNFIMPIAVRVNPRVSFANAKIKMSGVASQFGIEEESLNDSLFSELQKLRNISLMGIQVYMGTQILNAEDLVKNTEYIIELALRLSAKYGFSLQYLNMGGGFGIPYFPNETELDMRKLKAGFSKLDEIYADKLANTELIFESGRYIMAEAGVFVTKALYCKESKGNSYIVCDGGSNFHGASAFLGRFVRNNYPMYVVNSKESKISTNVTGPLCTPADIIGQKVCIGNASVGDIIVIEKSGAYGLTHSPLKFLSHEAPAEVVFYDEQYHVLREREKVDSFLLGQNTLDIGDEFE